MGAIVLELDAAAAPVTTANFLAYAQRGADGGYDGTIFHRVKPGFVIQGGGYTADMKPRPSGAPIINEWRNGLRNLRGTVAMARDIEPDSATREFYINLADNPRLDVPRERTGNAGYAVFGRVVEGMDVVDRIGQVPTGPRRDPRVTDGSLDDVPLKPVVIERVERLAREKR
jgi:cyclophilin family peptidyl-prolyl cis-trans isomerase